MKEKLKNPLLYISSMIFFIMGYFAFKSQFYILWLTIGVIYGIFIYGYFSDNE